MYDIELSLTKQANGTPAQAVTASAASTQVINLGSPGPLMRPLHLHLRVTETFTADGAATMAVDLQSDNAAAFSSPATLQALMPATGKATFVKGYHRVWPVPMQNLEQYLRAYFTVATGPMTAGKVVMYINDDMEL